MNELTEEQVKVIEECYKDLEAVGLGHLQIGAPYPKPPK